MMTVQLYGKKQLVQGSAHTAFSQGFSLILKGIFEMSIRRGNLRADDRLGNVMLKVVTVGFSEINQ